MEVFLIEDAIKSGKEGLLHVRGGVSGSIATQKLADKSSPRPWRCFLETFKLGGSSEVFSTSVEVFPRTSISSVIGCGLLHVRGGVSISAMRAHV